MQMTRASMTANEFSFSETKKRLREEMLARRDALTTEQRIEKSLEATAYGETGISMVPGTVVSGFFPIRSEIDPRPLMDALRRKGARLCLPVVLDRTTIIFRELVRGGELIDTGFGTRGPAESAEILDPDLMIMPMSVFDLHGGRIGYGAGHYDRAIARLIDLGRSPRLIGMAFDCQRVDTVPVEPHDQPLDAIITESGYHEVKK
jgi:5-formyltetrahydrofolate cyclo-ligase